LLFISKKSYASAWTRDKNEAIFVLETINSANKFQYIINSPDNKSYFTKQEYKLYGEYGITQNITVGGYFKLYSLKTKNEENNFEEISNDKFAEISITKKIFSDKNDQKILSFRTAYAKPIRYTKGKSERLNYGETREALDLRMLFGFSNEHTISQPYFISNGYFVNIETAIRILRDSFYNELVLDSTIGFKANQSSMILLRYDINYDYFQDSFFKKVNKTDSARYGQVVYGLRKENNYYLSDIHHQFKLSSLIRFEDNLALEVGIYKSFNQRTTTEGFNISLWLLI